MTRILVVEDDPDIQITLTYNLRCAGYDVVSAFTAGEALVSAREQRPDLVLLDMMLPDRSGLEVCQALRQQDAEHRTKLPIIVVSALSTESDRIASFQLGADDHVMKPFSVTELLLRVRAVLDRVRSKGDVSVSSALVEERERFRVWQGFARNHLQQSEWHDAREIYRAILNRCHSALFEPEIIEIREQIRECDRQLASH